MIRVGLCKTLALGMGVIVVLVILSRKLLPDHDRPLSKRFLSSLSNGATTLFPKGNGSSIMVTGGAGFLGSHLVDHLMQAGHQVIVVDSLVSGRRDNLAKWLDHPRFFLIEEDINIPLQVRTLDPDSKGKGGKNRGVVTIKKPVCTPMRCNYRHYHPRFALISPNHGRSVTVRVDQIYHLACPASVKAYMADPVFTITTNTQGTLNILELARKTGATVLLASTSEVYGDPSVVPQTEQYWGNVNPVGKRASYSEGKRAAEAMFISYNKQYDVDIRIARISNTYGPRLAKDAGGVVADFIKQALSNGPIHIYGNGNQTRCLQYVSDAVRGMVKLMKSRVIRPVNLAGKECLTVKKLAHSVIASTGTRSKIVTKPPRQDDPKLRKPDISLAGHVLHWQPKVTLKEGLKLTIDYFKKQQMKTHETDDTLRLGS